MDDDVRTAKQIQKDKQMGSQGTLDRQQIIQMVRERFMSDNNNKADTKVNKTETVEYQVRFFRQISA